MKSKVEKLSEKLNTLASIAETNPQAVHACFSHGFVSKWTYLTLPIENISHLLQPLEDTIREKLLPAPCEKTALNDEMWDLLALPCRLGRIGLLNPTELDNEAYAASKEVTHPIVNSILSKDGSYSYKALSDQLSVAAEIRKKNRTHQSFTASQLKANLNTDLQRAMDLVQEKGTLNWLTVPPVVEFGFSLHKGTFWDALALRYCWPLQNVPITCSCGKNFTVEHALSCAKGGYTSIRHNEVRDLTALLMTEVCHNVAVEPHLQPLNGEALQGASSITQDGARLDVAADGFWGRRFERAFFDVRVFNPYAPSNQRSSLQACYRNHENTKKRAYDQRIREVQHGTFCPLVFSCTGGLGRAAVATYKRL